jgi:hypothetical protein
MNTLKKSIELSVLAAKRCTRRAAGLRLTGLTLAQVIVLGVSVASLGAQSAFALDEVMPQDVTSPATARAPSGLSHRAKQVNFENESASMDARQVADWVVDSSDNQRMPFVIIDKMNGKVFVFDAEGRLRGAASALLGLAIGDDSVPGIGERKLSSIRPDERTTPAGRFEANLDRNISGKEILWVDYDAAISLHPVVTGNAKERRAERLATPSPLDNRISYGCINVPADFFAQVVSPAFKGTNGIVYVLPETRPTQQVFALYDVQERARLNMASLAVSAPVLSRPAANLAR